MLITNKARESYEHLDSVLPIDTMFKYKSEENKGEIQIDFKLNTYYDDIYFSVALQSSLQLLDVVTRPIRLSEFICLDGLLADAIDYLATGKYEYKESHEYKLRKEFTRDVSWCMTGASGFIIYKEGSATPRTQFGILLNRLDGKILFNVLWPTPYNSWHSLGVIRIHELIALRCLTQDAIEFLRKKIGGRVMERS